LSKIDLSPRIVPGKLNDKGMTLRVENVRLTFVNLDKPKAGFGGDMDKAIYSVTAIIPGKHYKRVRAEFTKFFEQMLKSNKKLPTPDQRLKALKVAMADGEDGAFFKAGSNQLDKEGRVRKGLEGNYTFSATMPAEATAEGYKPRFELTLRDRQNQPIPAHRIREEFYSGCWGDLSINVSAYDYMKKCGIKAYLNGVMKTVNDERLVTSDPFAVRDDLPEDDTLSEYADTTPDFESDSEPPKKKRK
jgi:hypothetical protein